MKNYGDLGGCSQDTQPRSLIVKYSKLLRHLWSCKLIGIMYRLHICKGKYTGQLIYYPHDFKVVYLRLQLSSGVPQYPFSHSQQRGPP